MQENDNLSGWRMQGAEGVLLLILGAAGGLIDAYRGYAYGIATSPVMAAIYVTGAVGVVCLHSRHWIARIGLVVCLASTLLAGAMEARTELSGHLHTAVTQNGNYDTAKGDEKTAREALVKIKETGSVEGLEEKKRLKEGEKKAACKSKTGTDDCRIVTDELARAIARVDEAKARERAQKALDAAQTRLKEIGTPAQISAVGASAETEDRIAWIKTGLALAVTQALAMNTGNAWAQMTGAWARRRKEREERERAAVAKEREGEEAATIKVEAAIAGQKKEDVKRELAKKAIASKNQEELTFDKLLLFVEDEYGTGGEADNQRVLADKLGVHENTMKRYLKNWSSPAAGLIKVHKLGGTKIRVEMLKPWTHRAKSAKPKLRAIG